MDELNFKLINFVKSEPSIYDKTNLFYSNKDHVKLIWFNIANQLQLTVPVCQKRWRYLRDYFVRQLHIGQNENKKSSWPLFDLMSFLIPFSSTRKPRSETSAPSRKRKQPKSETIMENGDSVLSVQSSDNEFNSFDYLNMYQAHFSGVQLQPNHETETLRVLNDESNLNNNLRNNEENNNSVEYSTKSTEHPSKFIEFPTKSVDYLTNSYNSSKKPYSKMKTKTEILNELLQLLKNNNNSGTDEHEYFFKSLLSNVKEIDDKFIIQFRSEILQIVMKYRILSQHQQNHEKQQQQNGISSTCSSKRSRRDSNASDIVIIDTGESNWRNKLSKI